MGDLGGGEEGRWHRTDGADPYTPRGNPRLFFRPNQAGVCDFGEAKRTSRR